MATITATKGIRTAFAGGVDVIQCDFSPAARKGVQVEVEGFTIDVATVTVKGASSSPGDVIPFTEAKHIGVINSTNGALIGQVQLSAVAGGSYFVTFIEL